MNGLLRALFAVFVSLCATTAWAQATAQINGRACWRTPLPLTSDSRTSRASAIRTS
jgi:hypothetical protein